MQKAGCTRALRAELRAFSAVLQITVENLATLQRAESASSSLALSANQFGDASYDGYHAPAHGLFERFGLYDERDQSTSIWPRSGMQAIELRRP